MVTTKVDHHYCEKLKWRSRRAMLELDILLSDFWVRVENKQVELTEMQFNELEELLELDDFELLGLITEARKGRVLLSHRLSYSGILNQLVNSSQTCV